MNGMRIACWRVRGDAARRVATGTWQDGKPSQVLREEYHRCGLRIEFAYVRAAARRTRARGDA